MLRGWLPRLAISIFSNMSPPLAGSSAARMQQSGIRETIFRHRHAVPGVAALGRATLGYT
jgi:hypothetical protein